MSKITIKFKVEELELSKLLEQIKTINNPIVTKLKNVLANRLKNPHNKIPPNPKKKSRERIKTHAPENLQYRPQKYVVDYYNSLTHPKSWEVAEEFRRELKNEKVTESETKFKAVLKAIGVKYEFQHILFVNTNGKFFILDFYLPDYNVGIEIDGGYHFTHDQYLKDSERTKTILKFIKIRSILRFKNSDITMNEEFLNKVKRILNDSGLSRVKLKEF